MFTNDFITLGFSLLAALFLVSYTVVVVIQNKLRKEEAARILQNFKLETQSDIRIQAIRIYVQNPRFGIPSGDYESDLVRVVKMMEYNFKDPKWMAGEGLLVARSVLDERYRTSGHYIV